MLMRSCLIEYIHCDAVIVFFFPKQDLSICIGYSKRVTTGRDVFGCFLDGVSGSNKKLKIENHFMQNNKLIHQYVINHQKKVFSDSC